MITENGSTLYTAKELHAHARELRRKARKVARAAGFEPKFSDDFAILYNERHNYLHLQIRYTVNGSAQVEGVAI